MATGTSPGIGIASGGMMRLTFAAAVVGLVMLLIVLLAAVCFIALLLAERSKKRSRARALAEGVVPLPLELRKTQGPYFLSQDNLS
jgi:hypothetical protein